MLFVMLPASCGTRRSLGSRENELIASQEIGNLLANRILLIELRNNRVSNVLEGLEFAIDSSVVILDAKIGTVGGPTEEQALTTLRIIRDYRRENPRYTSNARESGSRKGSTNDISLKAARILDELK